MKTPTKKKAVKKKLKKPIYIYPKQTVKELFTVNGMTNSEINKIISHTLYELYRTKSGSWKFRKRARNGEILNHSCNRKSDAIKGMKADFRLTKEMSELKWKEVK